MTKTLLLDCGSGGRASQRLINELFLEQFDNPILRTLDDAAKLELSGPIAMSTDGYTVTPLFFPGGNIGTLAVHGTVNDVSMLGARPRYLTCGFILEEGLDLDLLIVSGDSKGVSRGACDKLFITTAGVGEILADPSPSGSGARPGDAILVSGAVGDHGLAVLGQRDSLSFLQGVESDSAALNKMVERLMLEVGDIHVLRDPTRGGLATTLNEIAGQSGVVCSIEEVAIPIHDAVRSGCDVLGSQGSGRARRAPLRAAGTRGRPYRHRARSRGPVPSRSGRAPDAHRRPSPVVHARRRPVAEDLLGK